MWNFIQNQVLGMHWLNALIDGLLQQTGLDTSSRIGGSVQFFLYDVIKITVATATDRSTVHDRYGWRWTANESYG